MNSTLQVTSNTSPMQLNRTLRRKRTAFFLHAEQFAKRLLFWVTFFGEAKKVTEDEWSH